MTKNHASRITTPEYTAMLEKKKPIFPLFQRGSEGDFLINHSFKFAKLADDYLTEEELHELKLSLAINPDAAVVIPGSGGCRKLRWRVHGRYVRLYFEKVETGD